MKIIIKHADNGAVVEVKDSGIIETLVYKFDNDMDADDIAHIAGFIEMLYLIIEKFRMGVADRGFKKYAVDVKEAHGDEYECKGCEICK